MNERINNQSSDNPDCEAIRALIPAYALGAVDPDERQQVEEWLSRCPEAAAELQVYRAMGDAMLFSAPPVALPPALKNKLLAAAVPAEKPAAVTVRTSGFWEQISVFWGVRRRGVAFGLALVALLIVTNLYWINKVGQLRDQHETLSTQYQQQEALIQLLGGSESNWAELVSTQNDAAHVSVTWATGPQDNTWIALLNARDLPPLSRGMAYQLWLRRGDYRISGGVFKVDESGNGMLIFTTTEPIGTFEAMGITPEPEGGSEGPTAPPVVAGEI
jgi:anti-sigma-K factor RskA